MSAIDMAGKQCGLLTVLGRSPERMACDKVGWICECICGARVVVNGTKLRNGHTRSCGCYRRPAFDRFIEKAILKPSGCIEWTGGLNGVGYGQFSDPRTSNRSEGKVYAHRWSYEYFVGPIPDGLHLDHLCRNPKCVNPSHLEPVTPRVNILRGVGMSAKHATKTHCPAGHPYAGDNLYIHPTKGYRACRICGKERALARRRAARVKAGK